MKIHFIGICGVAMSALAIAFKKAGWIVTGSDAGFFPPVSINLEKHGVSFYPGWHPQQMIQDGIPDLVVVGNVASSTNPEWTYVQKHKLNYKSYPEVIAKYFVKQNSIVCAGTYGKTTTAALLSWIFLQCGQQPSYMFGGLLQDSTLTASLSDSAWSILEGDEYKSARWDTQAKFLHYKPTQLLLTGIEWDHADIYPTEQSYRNAFTHLIEKMPSDGLIALSDSIESSMKKTIRNKGIGRVISYGADPGSAYGFKNLVLTRQGMNFEIVTVDNKYNVTTHLLGEYMAENITGCFALAMENSLPAESVIYAIQSFPGIKRRLEKRYNGDILLIDDIAHSPKKAAATLGTLRKICKGKIIAIFEPNTGNRRNESIPGYANAFKDADVVIIPRLTKIKQDAHEPVAILSGDELSKVIQKTHPNASYIDNDDQLIEHVFLTANKDDAIVFLGSHGFRGMIESLIQRYS